ncbi:hypothetical protein [Mucilaginibacter myungsuensis]|uniref:Uncharacterized protein n=1 Tax=Mucilaginibacter myungsuensis TaxID=649104 RepID=A0A929PXS9_9SPHI|nr:hypothetical protein [Mucilaginibacter myungsuensis]MBE9663486.1 hypothetical protein [Mucilaginibacter myungsuensis]MDN3600224.1 hypothetical protein [Mucilaginibacter myungsuensis]
MKNLLTIFLTLLFALTASAQKHIRLFLGDREINPHSVHYLDPKGIDAIKFAVGASAKKELNIDAASGDSVFVIEMKDRTGQINYDQVLEMYNVDSVVKKFAMTSGSDGMSGYEAIQHPKTLVFHKSRLAGITVDKPPVSSARPNPMIVVMHIYNRAYKSAEGRILHYLQGAVNGYGDNEHFKMYKP